MIYANVDTLQTYLTLSLLGLVGFCLWYLATSGNRYWRSFPEVPFIPGLPVVGNFLDAVLMRQSMFDLFDELYKQQRDQRQPLFGVSLFYNPALVLKDPDLIKQLLIKDATYFSNRYMCADPHGDDIGYYNLLMIKNPLWKQLRSYLTPALSISKTKKMYTLVDQVGATMVDCLEQLPLKAARTRETEFKELCARYTTDVIASTFFGIQANCLKDERAEFRYYGKKIFEYGLTRGFTMASMFFMPELATIFRLKLFPRDTEAFLKSIIVEEIARRESSGGNRGDFIDSLIALKNNKACLGTDKQIPIDGDILVAQAATFYMASFETTSSVLSFALYELTRHPDIQARLREEIQQMVDKYGKELPYECMVNEMPYLGMVISETSRLYPVLPFIERQCSVPEGATGYKLEPFHSFVVPNKMPVLIPIYAIHRDPMFFPDPLKFDPERFSKDNLVNITPCSFMPFGIGPRTCLGSHFGTLQVKVAIVRILSKYRIECSESTPASLTFRKVAFTLHSNEGLYANLVEDELVGAKQ